MTSRPSPSVPRRSTRERGFSLIEVLVSIFIVSMGILALGGLLQSASRYGKMSELRSTATLLANDIADRIRANPGAATTDYAIGSAGFPTDVAASATDCVQLTPCSVTGLAQHDMYAWTKRVRYMLPSGSAYIEYKAPGGTSTSNGVYDIWVAWSDPGTGTGATERSATECPAAWNSPSTVRCVYVQVGL